ncbi:MAG: hypothetical protein U1F15_01400 [Burkholderiales bacterium]
MSRMSRPGLASVAYGAVVTAALAAWHAKVTGTLAPAAVAAFGALAALCLVLGSALAAFAPVAAADRASLNFRFVVGYLGVNTLLFALAIASPLTIAGNVALCAAFALAVAWSARGRVRALAPAPAAPEMIALVVAATAATLWCRDGLTPIVADGANSVIRLWGDTYVHARITSALAQSTGLATFSDIRMADTPVYLYHYAFYATPAALSALTGAPAFDVYASFLLPFGVLLTALAAFALVRSWWGAWPALAAAIAVVALPDAYQQGFANRYLSYHFMQQVNPGGLYGVACAALAWLFVIAGTRSGRYAAIAIGFALAGLTLFYKAHVFVANALLILVYPCLFLARPRPAWRAAALVGVVVVYAFALVVGGELERAPTIRFDGSGAAAYVARIAWNYEPGILADRLAGVTTGPPLTGVALYAIGVPMLLASTFGLWLVAAVAVGVSLRSRAPSAILWFPALVVANYLAMAFGLALDTKGIGSPDELLNRPLVWAYFVVAAWTAGGAWHRAFGDALPVAPAARGALALAAVACLAFPWRLGPNLQTYPRWPGFETYASANTVPTCVVDAARFLRGHSRVGDVIQDSENDPRFLVTAFAERQGYVTFADNRPPAAMADRMRDLAAWRQMADAGAIRRFAAERGIAWYLLRPTTAVAWPSEILAAPAFECGGFRVYRFAR